MEVNSKEGIFPLVLLSTLTIISIAGGQVLVRSLQPKLDPNFSNLQLWKTFRWSVDPSLRRQAALLLVGKSKESPGRQQRLLAGQGWGQAPLSAVALKFQAQTAQKMGASSQAKDYWIDLIRKFPKTPATADAYYILGRRQPQLREQLLNILPAHPASLAAALELSITEENSYQGVLHLARWGPRWHGAANLMRRACEDFSLSGPTNEQRKSLAMGLAKTGDGLSAFNCLTALPEKPELVFPIAKNLLQGDAESQKKGKSLIMGLLRSHPKSKESLFALRELSNSQKLTHAVLSSLPKSLVHNSASIAAAKVRLSLDKKPELIIRRWHDHPEIWELQWELVRESLLAEQWDKANFFLGLLESETLPDAISARQMFWRGYVHLKQGNQQEANNTWKQLIASHQNGYYSWRALSRLGAGKLPKLRKAKWSSTEPILWRPLPSRYDLVNLLWRLGLEKDAWETWRTFNSQRILQNYEPMETLSEGILRMSVGDDWSGLSKLNALSLDMVGKDCSSNNLLHQSQHPYRFLAEVEAANKETGIKPELLLAISKQESRFSPGVKSSQGAIGLMQLMPQTASDLTNQGFDDQSLDVPSLNILLGARYLSNLLEMWEDNIFLTLASYNAGPQTVKGWVENKKFSEPEVWVEAIPYPETRFYVKSVLSNLWSYLNIHSSICDIKSDVNNKN